MVSLEYKQCVGALVAGVIFGLGLSVSGMINPAKVLNFLDLFGSWDPSLIFVMLGGIVVTFLGYRYINGIPKPFYDEAFHTPLSTQIDKKLIVGAVLFGLGWGLAGLCPGPAIAGLVMAKGKSVLFVLSMFAGFYIFQLWEKAD